MLVFNCTKAAAEFFSISRKNTRVSPLEKAPEKTIAESIQANSPQSNPLPTDIKPASNIQWHWLVHAVKIKRQNVLILMDYHSRFAMTFTCLKKGDDSAFLQMFQQHLNFHIHELLPQVLPDPGVIHTSFEQYRQVHAEHVFYRRGDRSVQGHINDVSWHIEMTADEMGELPTGINLIAFDCYINNTIRNSKGKKGYFIPLQDFLHQWLYRFAGFSQAQADKLIKELQKKEKARYQAMHNSMCDIVADTIEAKHLSGEVEAMLMSQINGKPATGDRNNVIQVDFSQKKS